MGSLWIHLFFFFLLFLCCLGGLDVALEPEHLQYRPKDPAEWTKRLQAGESKNDNSVEIIFLTVEQLLHVIYIYWNVLIKKQL